MRFQNLFLVVWLGTVARVSGEDAHSPALTGRTKVDPRDASGIIKKGFSVLPPTNESVLYDPLCQRIALNVGAMYEFFRVFRTLTVSQIDIPEPNLSKAMHQTREDAIAAYADIFNLTSQFAKGLDTLGHIPSKIQWAVRNMDLEMIGRSEGLEETAMLDLLKPTQLVEAANIIGVDTLHRLNSSLTIVRKGFEAVATANSLQALLENERLRHQALQEANKALLALKADPNYVTLELQLLQKKDDDSHLMTRIVAHDREIKVLQDGKKKEHEDAKADARKAFDQMLVAWDAHMKRVMKEAEIHATVMHTKVENGGFTTGVKNFGYGAFLLIGGLAGGHTETTKDLQGAIQAKTLADNDLVRLQEQYKNPPVFDPNGVKIDEVYDQWLSQLAEARENLETTQKEVQKDIARLSGLLDSSRVQMEAKVSEVEKLRAAWTQSKDLLKTNGFDQLASSGSDYVKKVVTVTLLAMELFEGISLVNLNEALAGASLLGWSEELAFTMRRIARPTSEGFWSFLLGPRPLSAEKQRKTLVGLTNIVAESQATTWLSQVSGRFMPLEALPSTPEGCNALGGDAVCTHDYY